MHTYKASTPDVHKHTATSTHPTISLLFSVFPTHTLISAQVLVVGATIQGEQPHLAAGGIVLHLRPLPSSLFFPHLVTETKNKGYLLSLSNCFICAVCLETWGEDEEAFKGAQTARAWLLQHLLASRRGTSLLTLSGAIAS